MALVLKQLLLVCPDGYGDRPDRHGWYPLHRLASNSDTNGVRAGMIRTLCEAGATLEVRKGRGQTPLMAAVATSHRAAADELVQQGADPYATNDEGVTCLDAAWHNRQMSNWARQLGIGQGAGVSGTGRLHFTCCVRRQASYIPLMESFL